MFNYIEDLKKAFIGTNLIFQLSINYLLQNKKKNLISEKILTMYLKNSDQEFLKTKKSKTNSDYNEIKKFVNDHILKVFYLNKNLVISENDLKNFKLKKCEQIIIKKKKIEQNDVLGKRAAFINQNNFFNSFKMKKNYEFIRAKQLTKSKNSMF